MPAEGVPLLQMRGITKSFFGVPVLDAVDLDVMAGDVHPVVGENRASDVDPVPLNQYVETASSSSCPVTALSVFDGWRPGDFTNISHPWDSSWLDCGMGR